MSRVQADQVIDEEEVDTCPLCIEELDLQDRHFHPCPCGYQICFFCYNNIKSTMNGLCPACRRPYDDNPVFEQPTAEEKAIEKERLATQAKKKAAARQKEALKREADTMSRKHLAGIRVRQKNLVYVTGFRPTVSEAQLAETLRQEQYFGQYGKIVKIVVSKAKESQPQHSVGVYVTFEDKDAAAKCIQAVDGVQNGDGRLRAQYGTTKYCSAYVRNEPCTNRNCMFLHEPGEENESFTRQDLSSLNVASSQSHPQNSMPQSSYSYSQAPPQQGPQSIAAAATLSTSDNLETLPSQGDEPKRPALPSHASWADKPVPTRKTSQGPGASGSSPSFSDAQQDTSQQATKRDLSEPTSTTSPSISVSASASQTDNAKHTPSSQKASLHTEIGFSRQMHKALASDGFKFVFDEASVQEDLVELVKMFPGLFHPSGNFRRQALGREGQRRQDNQVAAQVLAVMEGEEATGGSLQLGGEPEDRELGGERSQNAIHPPAGDAMGTPNFNLDHALSPSNASIQSLGSRSTVPQQQHQYLLQQFKSASPGLFNQGSNTGLSQPSQLGHSRQTSRFSFANDSTASTQVKPTANPKILSQQSSMMPPQQSSQFNQFQQQQQHAQQQQGKNLFSSGVQGPPPGLKATGTPPVSGGGMFGQGHGFATAGLGYHQTGRNGNPNDEMMRELLRNRGGSAGSGQASDGGRRITPALPSKNLAYAASSGDLIPTLEATQRSTSLYRSTPPLPPGLGAESRPRAAIQELPGLGSLAPTQKVSRSVVNRQDEQISGASASARPQPRAYFDNKAREGRSTTTPTAVTTPFEETAFPALPKPSAAATTKLVQASARSASVSTKQAKKEVTQQQPSPKKLEDSAVPEPQKAGKEPTSQLKREAPSKLDISAAKPEDNVAGPSTATTSSAFDGSKVGTPSHTAPQSPTGGSAATDSRPSTPVDSRSKRNTQPRTIRVLATPKTEAPPPVASTTAEENASRSGSPSVSQARRSSRRPSISSVSNAPGTPANERISDNASVTTESQSRANSPPPAAAAKVSNTATRTKTKSQVKKEKQERTQVDNGGAPVSATTAESTVMQEPIVGRRRKTRKPTPATGSVSKESTSNTPTPSESRAPSPKRAPSVSSKMPSEPAEPKTASPEESEEPSESNPPSASAADSVDIQQLLSELSLAELEGVPLEESAFFRVGDASLVALVRAALSGLDFRYLAPQGPLSAEEMAKLDAGEPVRRRYRPTASSDPSEKSTATAGNETDDQQADEEDQEDELEHKLMSHLLITPARRCLHALPPKVQDRYLALEAQIAASRRSGVAYNHRADMLVPPGVSDKVAKSLKPFDVDELLRDKAAALMRPPTTTTAAATAAAQAAAAAAIQKSSTAATTSKRTSYENEDSDEEDEDDDENDDIEEGAEESITLDAHPETERYADEVLAYLNTYILPLHPRAPSFAAPRSGVPSNTDTSRVSSSYSSSMGAQQAPPPPPPPPPPTKPSISTAIPRLYTTGHPTYSISGADLVSSTQSQSQSQSQSQTQQQQGTIPQYPAADRSRHLYPLPPTPTTTTTATPSDSQATTSQPAKPSKPTKQSEINRQSKQSRTEELDSQDPIKQLERALAVARKEHELIERKVAGLVKRNRRLISSSS